MEPPAAMVPTYIRTPGVYTVSLTLTGPGGTNTETKTNYVSIYTPPSARFIANVLSGKAPLQVIFTDSSRGDVTTWQWDFGMEEAGSNKSPTHTYNKSGTYSVTLTASGPGGTDTETKPDYLIVKPPPRAANFITNFADVEIAETVRFTIPPQETLQAVYGTLGTVGQDASESRHIPMIHLGPTR